MFNRIVAATDIVTTTDAPVISAVRLARQQDSRLYLLHVMESASTENRRLIRHFETGAEMIADADYEQTIRHRFEPFTIATMDARQRHSPGAIPKKTCRRFIRA